MIRIQVMGNQVNVVHSIVRNNVSSKNLVMLFFHGVWYGVWVVLVSGWLQVTGFVQQMQDKGESSGHLYGPKLRVFKRHP